ncbi:hypothetical protein [Streptomyces sp. NPDC050804]|uniref:hypothetical protein n=1 Tax=unclassified Streptomyces TaxID=2593676 RepID=UPI0034254ACF|nr:hypothetical protein OG214_22500 [Streptomyces sp. NBC_00872]
MIRVKSLIKHANPVPGAEPVPGPAVSARRGPGRRTVLVTALAGGTAAVVAGVAFLATGGGGWEGPGGRSPGGGGAIADQAYYGSTGQLEAAADVIVRGRLGPGREEGPDAGRGQAPDTVAPVEVTATAKGEVPGARIELSYVTPGAAAETAPLTAGKEYVFLLTEDGERAGRYYLVSTMQGWYGVDGDGRAAPGPENTLSLSAEVRKALGLGG